MNNPARNTTVTNVVRRPGTGSPIANLGVTIRLNVLGFADGGATETVATRTVQTDADGRWSVALAANVDIDPAGTYYTVHEGKVATWSIVVPPAGSPVNLRDILVTDPANPSPLVAGVPLPGSGVPANYVWTTDGAGGGDYAPETGGGGGAPSGPAGGVLSGTYPDPGFAVDMATQAELDAESSARSTADTTLAGLITGEAATARAAESANATAIATEATTRGNAITTEAAARAAADALLIPLTQKGAANGVASLGSDGLVPTAQIPALALTTAVTVASQAAMLALTSTQVQPGDIAVRTDGAGTFILTAVDPSVLGNWTRLNAPTDVVVSVNGQVGTVNLAASDVGAQSADPDLTTIAGLDATVAGALATDGAGWIRKTYAQLKTALGLVKADVGLGSVDNTADASKPVSTLQAAADAAVQAFAIQRANHTGTQSADTITDGTTNKVLTATDKTRLANTSGTNTGDQTLPTTLPPNGAAGGDLAGTYPNPTLATGIVSAGTTGDATHSLTLTVDGKGRVTGVTSNAIAIPESAVTNLTTDLAAKIPNSIGTTKGDQIGFTGSGAPVRHAIGADGTVQTADSTQADGWKWAAVSGGVGIYGDGSDGAVTFDGTTTVLGVVPASSVYTLARDLYCTNLTINNGVTIKANLFRIFCTGTLTNNGSITSSAVLSTLQNGGGGVNNNTSTINAASLGAGTGGGGSTTTTGAAGTTQASQYAIGGLGGGGGAGASGAGGAGGAISSPPTSVTTHVRSSVLAALGQFYLAGSGGQTARNIFAGTGGGGGGGDGTNSGGGGGGGGGIIIIIAKTFAGTGVIQARGGAGVTRTSGNVGGGGGGGGGVVIVVSGSVASGAVSGQTIDANGGAAGAGFGTGATGTAGAAGTTILIPN